MAQEAGCLRTEVTGGEVFLFKLLIKFKLKVFRSYNVNMFFISSNYTFNSLRKKPLGPALPVCVRPRDVGLIDC